MLFQSQYRFFGTHADKVVKLTAEFEGQHKLFSFNHEVYQLAPIVGFLYNRKAEKNREGGKDTSIFAEQMSNYKDVFHFNYQLIMLVDKNHEPDFDTRVDKAFRFYGTDKANIDEELYESYVLGGVDVLYEKLIENSKAPEDYINNLYAFLKDFETRYGQIADEIYKLCDYSGDKHV
ncbi:MAG: hypothetical protein FWG98_06225 [Candidatus Cloacimonetes bacterium]|nr:hypothetical protein [Candidatus Cloacimonadota bacterium]